MTEVATLPDARLIELARAAHLPALAAAANAELGRRIEAARATYATLENDRLRWAWEAAYRSTSPRAWSDLKALEAVGAARGAKNPHDLLNTPTMTPVEVRKASLVEAVERTIAEARASLAEARAFVRERSHFEDLLPRESGIRSAHTSASDLEREYLPMAREALAYAQSLPRKSAPAPSPELHGLLVRVEAARNAAIEELPEETFDGDPLASAVLAAAPTEADLAHLLATGHAEEARRRVARLEALLAAARSGVTPGSLDPDAFRAPAGSFASFVAARPVPFAQRFGAGAPEPIDASTQFARAANYAMARYRRTVASLKTIAPLKADAFRKRLGFPNWETEFHKAKTLPAINALLKRLDAIDAEVAPLAASYVPTPLTSFKAIVDWYQNELPNYYKITPADFRERVTIDRGSGHPIVLTPAAMGALPIGRLLANRWWEAEPYEYAVRSALDAAIAAARQAGTRRDQPIPVLVRFHGIAEPTHLVARVVGDEIVLDVPSRFGAGDPEPVRPKMTAISNTPIDDAITARQKALARAAERIGWNVEDVEIDYGRRTARVWASRGNRRVMLDLRNSKGTIERFERSRARVPTGRRGDRFIADRISDEFLGRMSFQNQREALSEFVGYLVANGNGNVDELGIGAMLALPA